MQPVQVCRTSVCMLSEEALHVRAPDNSIACCHTLVVRKRKRGEVLGPDKQRQSLVLDPCLTASYLAVSFKTACAEEMRLIPDTHREREREVTMVSPASKSDHMRERQRLQERERDLQCFRSQTWFDRSLWSQDDQTVSRKAMRKEMYAVKICFQSS